MLVMLSQQVAEQARIMEIENVDADLGHHAGELFSFVFHSLSPMSWTMISRVRERLSKSIKMTCCQVPKHGWPFSIGIATDGPNSEARRWEKPLSSPQRSS